MRTLYYLLQKEFRQIFRDRIILVMIIVLPVAQLIILPLAANYEVRNIYVAVVDHDHTTASKALVEKIASSEYFKVVAYTERYRDAMSLIESNEADIILEIPVDFDRDRERTGTGTLFMAVNAINGVKANLGAAYLGRVIKEQYAVMASPVIDVRPSNWYNIHLDYRRYMVPGILAMLVSMIAVYLSALNIVREKEVGTIEQINVTPITRLQFISGKLIPFLVLGFVIFTIGMLLGRFIYGVVPAGSVLLLYGFVAIYLVAVLGLGLLISTFANTQQQAMFVAFFFMMIFIMMGGLFTPIESMPPWAQMITLLNPVRYLIDVMRLVVLKGSGIAELQVHFIVITAMAIVLNTMAVLNYRKTSG